MVKLTQTKAKEWMIVRFHLIKSLDFFFSIVFFRKKKKTETDCFINCWKGNFWWNATNSVANFLVGLLIDKLWHMCKSKWNLFSLRLLNESFPCTLRESFRNSVNFNSWYISPARLWNHKSWQFLNNDVYEFQNGEF